MLFNIYESEIWTFLIYTPLIVQRALRTNILDAFGQKRQFFNLSSVH